MFRVSDWGKIGINSPINLYKRSNNGIKMKKMQISFKLSISAKIEREKNVCTVHNMKITKVY